MLYSCITNILSRYEAHGCVVGNFTIPELLYIIGIHNLTFRQTPEILIRTIPNGIDLNTVIAIN